MSRRHIPTSPCPIPDEEVLFDVYNLPVLSADGKSCPFGDLIAVRDRVTNVIVIFVRHFFCSCDQDYVRSISESLTPNVLGTLPIGPSRLFIIGCGEASRIHPYAVETSCQIPIFTDPTGRIYEHLRMKKSLTISPRPPYMKHSLPSLVIRSANQMIGSGYGAFKGGNFWQNGGEWIFREGKCVWVHRMETTADHLTAESLLKVLSGDECCRSVTCRQ